MVLRSGEGLPRKILDWDEAQRATPPPQSLPPSHGDPVTYCQDASVSPCPTKSLFFVLQLLTDNFFGRACCYGKGFIEKKRATA